MARSYDVVLDACTTCRQALLDRFAMDPATTAVLVLWVCTGGRRDVRRHPEGRVTQEHDPLGTRSKTWSRRTSTHRAASTPRSCAMRGHEPSAAPRCGKRRGRHDHRPRRVRRAGRPTRTGRSPGRHPHVRRRHHLPRIPSTPHGLTAPVARAPTRHASRRLGTADPGCAERPRRRPPMTPTPSSSSGKPLVQATKLRP